MFFFKNLILTCLLSLLVPIVFRDEQRQFTISGIAQGTDYTIKYYAKDSVVTRQDIEQILMQIDSSMSLYKPYSRITRFNQAKEGIQIDEHFRKVLLKAWQINKVTAGRFDATVAPLVNAWGFGPAKINKIPDSATIRSLLPCVGMEKLKLQGSYLKKLQPCVEVDLNGIAQGYTVDVLASHFLKKGVSSFVVELGGELRVHGRKPDGSLYKVGVEGPASAVSPEPGIRHVLGLRNGAVTTSGNYRKYIDVGGERISHLVDPKSGYPLRSKMISVTVYAKDALTADGYDNALMAMDVQQALAVARAQKFEAYLIYQRDDGSVADTLTSGFRKLIID
ncbi:FAD:protein FMN transferase [Pedobacter deserti]|uniref:FAD:protein FMN transferase n=1 Tax=Pedobacter deserti TaxID=2817382 RepID=UPI0021092EF3